MESPSAPEQSSPESWKPTPLRPPGVEFALGIAVFGFTLTVLFTVQAIVFMHRVADLVPGHEGFSFSLLQNEDFMRAAQAYERNGDVLGPVAIWGSLAALAALLGLTFLWKGVLNRGFLGLSIGRPAAYLKWILVFAVLVAGIEVLGRTWPMFRTDLMDDVLASTTKIWPLLLGVGILQPVLEEFLLRGVLLGSLRHVADEHTAIALSAGVFALMHLQYDWPVMLLIVPMGAVLGYARTRSGSIWVPVLLHVLNNSLSVCFT